MAYVICEPCVDVMDTACVDVCPVDCIHTTDGHKQLYINPAECIDCGACEPACPVAAIFIADEVPEKWASYTPLNAKFFETFVKPKKGGGEGGAKGEGAADDEDKIGIEEFVQMIEAPPSALRSALRPIIMLSQPILGAFSAKFKQDLEETAANPVVFSAAISTGINSLINLTLYPLLFFFIAVKLWNVSLFSGSANLAIFLGVVLAIGEGIFRFKDELVSTPDDTPPRFGAALYGWIPSLVVQFLWSSLKGAVATKLSKPRSTLPGAVLTDGPIYEEDYRERYRRYGMVNHLTERADHYVIEIEFPRWVPNSIYKEKYNLPDRMPDYTYEVKLEGNVVVVEARLEDPRFKLVTDRSSSFPSGFRNTFHLEGNPEDFQAMYRDKALQVIVPKSGKVEDLVIEKPVHYAKLKG